LFVSHLNRVADDFSLALRIRDSQFVRTLYSMPNDAYRRLHQQDIRPMGMQPQLCQQFHADYMAALFAIPAVRDPLYMVPLVPVNYEPAFLVSDSRDSEPLVKQFTDALEPGQTRYAYSAPGCVSGLLRN